MRDRGGAAGGRPDGAQYPAQGDRGHRDPGNTLQVMVLVMVIVMVMAMVMVMVKVMVHQVS